MQTGLVLTSRCPACSDSTQHITKRKKSLVVSCLCWLLLKRSVDFSYISILVWIELWRKINSSLNQFNKRKSCIRLVHKWLAECSSSLHFFTFANIWLGCVVIIMQVRCFMTWRCARLISVVWEFGCFAAWWANSHFTCAGHTHTHKHTHQFYTLTATAIACPLTPEGRVGNILNILWSPGTPPLSSPPSKPPLLCPAVHTRTRTSRKQK